MDLITGASGFIGQSLFLALRQDGRALRGMMHTNRHVLDCVLADLSNIDSLREACFGVETLFHCAGYAHAFSAFNAADAARHWQVNFEGTRNLLEAAGEAGVKRFVFLSSVKAMADPGNVCADETFPGDPDSAYGKAKRAAEEAVLQAGRLYGMHVVNLRLAMVYGAGGRGNLERMAQMVRRGWFPALPETGNHRSLVHVDDVVVAMRLVAEDPRAAGQTYILASDEAPSGRALYQAIRLACGLAPAKWAVSVNVLKMAAGVGDWLQSLFGRRMPLNGEVLDRLLGSAWYSSQRIRMDLGWQARVSLAEGLREMLGK